MAVAIDTLVYARRLRDAGFTEQQAEGQADALATAMTETLATKQDLRELETRVDARFAAARQELRELETRMDARFAIVDGRFTQIEIRIDELEKRMALRFEQQAARFESRLADFGHRMTLRLGGLMVAGFGMMTALVRLS